MVNLVGTWSGRDADALRRAFRMSAEEFAAKLGASPRTVSGWREHPDRKPQMLWQEALDVLLESAPDRVKALFSASVGAEGNQQVHTTTLTPDDSERVNLVATNPSRLDTGTVKSLSVVLAGQRKTDDALGSEAVRIPVTAQLTTLLNVLKSTAGPEHDELARLTAEWATFTGWLHVSTGREDESLNFFSTAEEITDEVADGQLATTATSYKGYVALLQGHSRKAIRETAGSLATPGSHPTQRVYDLLQTAQAYAQLDDAREATRFLAEASELATTAGEPPQSVYWYTEPFFRLNIGLAYLGLSQYREAADSLRSGIVGIAQEQLYSDWMQPYRDALAKAEAHEHRDLAL